MSNQADRPGFSTEQARALAHVLDRIIPPSEDGRLPGAGQPGVVDHIETALARTPDLMRMILESLAALDEVARRRSAREFLACSEEDRSRAIDELAMSEHAFSPMLILHAYAGYYQQPRVLEALGMESRPPHPKGYTMEENDFSLLEPVRRRAKLYREC